MVPKLYLALQRAIEEGADFIETDVLASKEGVLICSHDVALDLDNRTNIANFRQFAKRKRTYEVQRCEHDWVVRRYVSKLLLAFFFFFLLLCFTCNYDCLTHDLNAKFLNPIFMFFIYCLEHKLQFINLTLANLDYVQLILHWRTEVTRSESTVQF